MDFQKGVLTNRMYTLKISSLEKGYHDTDTLPRRVNIQAISPHIRSLRKDVRIFIVLAYGTFCIATNPEGFVYVLEDLLHTGIVPLAIRGLFRLLVVCSVCNIGLSFFCFFIGTYIIKPMEMSTKINLF